MEKPPILKVPPLPAMPRPRPMSAYQQTERDAFKPTLGKSVSVGDIPRVTLAEGNDNYIVTLSVHLFSLLLCVIIHIQMSFQSSNQALSATHIYKQSV